LLLFGLSASQEEQGTMDIYLVAIGGTGMAPLACLLRDLGHKVRGSDLPLYPPMSDVLARAGIEPLVGWDPAHLDPPPELVVIGNAVPRHNPEVDAVERLGLPRISMPQALSRFVLAGRHPLVVAGTHGKTTTSSLAAFVFEHCGRRPGWLVGGLPFDLPSSFRLGTGDVFVLEGDEYNAAWFDRGPKFLHYGPKTLILTSAEHDHLDLYPTRESLLDAYRKLLAGMDPDSLVIACRDDADVREVLSAARGRVVTYGLSDQPRPGEAAVVIREQGPDGMRVVFTMPDGASTETTLRLAGSHNGRNALAVFLAATSHGIPANDAAAALAAFSGVRRRAEVVGEANGITVIDDFAHHPTAVETTLRGLAARFRGRRLVGVLEPRSLTSGRQSLADDWVRALAVADLAVIAPVFHFERLGAEALDAPRVAAEIRERGGQAIAVPQGGDTLATLLDVVKPGDVVVTMSSGSFDGLPRALVAALAT
jgi:UDP-N-acetylmuramate: L-alanyl-gamma-D-glutamyl-meso-diaminopimelate ligase